MLRGFLRRQWQVRMGSLPGVLEPVQAAAVVIRFLVLAVTEAMLDDPELRQPLAMAAAEAADQTVSLALLAAAGVSRFWTLEHKYEQIRTTIRQYHCHRHRIRD